ncbi:hypothetical protein Snov_1534 [Ancylobacter novellus DSM 506]|uniref:Uncharacterized protein n=1 Tax=Ancylobacter novellus (strain ATCC 8093 / DSM 506 / JCM 20403 / CCM 1077 / IAM 12100 / NBRC 12443 / NCIMB 10456) TaxID=639283 RepID=D7A9R8_ANCN5|nr:hypothetical protein [Ancylobacter novellus]ADH88844.1 hypothetical protein Snov_1534 [Ancylobacter novellus DSM 506]
MNNAVEERARAQCALDAQIYGVPEAQIPALVERLWPVVAREMMGVLDPETLPEPTDVAQREAEYRQLKRHMSVGG